MCIQLVTPPVGLIRVSKCVFQGLAADQILSPKCEIGQKTIMQKGSFFASFSLARIGTHLLHAESRRFPSGTEN